MTQKEFGEATALARLRIAIQAISDSFAYVSESEQLPLEVAAGNVSQIIARLEESVKAAPPEG